MEEFGVGFVGAGWILKTHHVGAWRVRNARAIVAYYKAEKGKKVSFPQRFGEFCAQSGTGKMESTRPRKCQFGMM